MNAQSQGYGRMRPNPRPRCELPPLVPTRPKRGPARSRRGFARLLPAVVCCLLMLAACSTAPPAPAVAPRIDLPPPKIIRPQRPEPLPAPLTRAIWRHGQPTPRLSIA